MADENQNNQNNGGGKNKGGGGGGNASGLSFNGKFDTASTNSKDQLLTNIIANGSNAVAFTVAVAVAGALFLSIKKAFGLKDVAPQQGGGGQGAISHPGQIAKAINQLKDHPQMKDFAPKIKEALGE